MGLQPGDLGVMKAQLGQLLVIQTQQSGPIDVGLTKASARKMKALLQPIRHICGTPSGHVGHLGPAVRSVKRVKIPVNGLEVASYE